MNKKIKDFFNKPVDTISSSSDKWIIIPLSIIFLIWILAIIYKDRKLEEVGIVWSKRNNLKALFIF